MKWPVETIDVVAQVNPKLAAADRPDLDEIVCFVPMAAVSEETQSIEAQAERPFSEVAKGYTPFKRGDVLIAKITPCFENGKMALADNLAHELGIGTTEFHVLRPSERITGPYLFNLLRAPHVRKAGAMRMKGAAGQRRVPADFFAALQIPLPPLAEQKRIAEILDKADSLRTKRRAALAHLDTLTQSVFLDMFGDPATNPKGWPCFRLGDVTDFYAGSTLPAGDAFDGQEDGYFLLKVSDMNLAGNEVYLESCQQWSAEPGAASSTCPAASIVIPKRGGAIGTNKKRIAVRPSVLDPNLMAIWPRPDLIELSFLYSWLLRLDLASITSGSSVPQLNKRDLDPISIPVPPLEAQREFSHKLGAMEDAIMLHDRALSICDTLFAVLQHCAFQGEL